MLWDELFIMVMFVDGRSSTDSSPHPHSVRDQWLLLCSLTSLTISESFWKCLKSVWNTGLHVNVPSLLVLMPLYVGN